MENARASPARPHRGRVCRAAHPLPLRCPAAAPRYFRLSDGLLPSIGLLVVPVALAVAPFVCDVSEFAGTRLLIGALVAVVVGGLLVSS